MRTAGIRLVRRPYEEPHSLHLVLSADNGVLVGCLEFYCNASDLKDVGEALRVFPKGVPDKYSYELGAPRPHGNWAYHLALRAYTHDRSGHCALQVIMDNNRDMPKEEACRFSIEAEPAAINRLGRLLLEFAKLKHHELIWTVAGEGDSLLETESTGNST